MFSSVNKFNAAGARGDQRSTSLSTAVRQDRSSCAALGFRSVPSSKYFFDRRVLLLPYQPRISTIVAEQTPMVFVSLQVSAVPAYLGITQDDVVAVDTKQCYGG